jgi:hypothetical protein
MGMQFSLLATPGLAGVQQVGGLLAVGPTAWPDARSLTGLQCIGSGAAFISNPFLTSFAGLGNLAVVGYAPPNNAVPVFQTSNNPTLAALGYLPLAKAAKCTGTTSPLQTKVSAVAAVGTRCPQTVSTWSGICLFSTGVCS